MFKKKKNKINYKYYQLENGEVKYGYINSDNEFVEVAEKKKKSKIKKKKEKEQILYDGYLLSEDEKSFIIDYLNSNNDMYTVDEIIDYLKNNESIYEEELITIDERAFNVINDCLIILKKKNKKKNSEILKKLAIKFMNKPKYYQEKLIPVDYETTNGKTYAFFNAEKTIKVNNLKWINKFIPLSFIEKHTYDNAFFDWYARKIQEPKYKKYNKLTKEQRMVKNFIKKFIKISVVSAFILTIIISYTFYSRPKKIYNEGLGYFNTQNYEQAYKCFSKIKYKDSYYRAGLAKLRINVERKNYKKASLILEKLENSNYIIPNIVYTNEYKEIKYQEAINYFLNKDYKNANSIFKQLASYKKSRSYYSKSMYRLANNYFDKNDYLNALHCFEQILYYSDSKKRYNEIGSSLYADALIDYKLKKYDEANKMFSKLAKSNYKDSKDMAKQCIYRNALDYLNKGEFTKCINTLKPILDFKDSIAISDEATYRYSKNLFENNVIMSISKFSNIDGYKDSHNYLINPKLALYGEWNIDQINDTKPEKQIIKFYDDNTINSNKELINIKISTKADKSPYIYADKNIYKCDNYQLELHDIDVNKIKLVAIHDNKKTTYKLSRNKNLNELLTYEDKNLKVLGLETKDVLLRKLVNNYLEMKKD